MKTCLVVDDSKVIRKVARHILETLDLEVTRLITAEDNDPEGRRARSKAWRAYRERGLALARMPPPEQYGDWADVLRPRS